MKRIILLGFTAICLSGCGTRTFTNTDRAAIEQLLLSGAVDKALEQLDVPQVAGNKTYIDFANLKCVDIEYVKAAMRARFSKMGALLVAEVNDADYIVEIASGTVGTEYKSFIVGIPSLPVPGLPTPTPELALAKSIEQSGIVKLLVFVRSNKGKFISSERYYGKMERDETFILWFRSQPKDDIRKAWEAADERVKAESTQKAD